VAAACPTEPPEGDWLTGGVWEFCELPDAAFAGVTKPAADAWRELGREFGREFGSDGGRGSKAPVGPGSTGDMETKAALQPLNFS